MLGRCVPLPSPGAWTRAAAHYVAPGGASIAPAAPPSGTTGVSGSALRGGVTPARRAVHVQGYVALYVAGGGPAGVPLLGARARRSIHEETRARTARDAFCCLGRTKYVRGDTRRPSVGSPVFEDGIVTGTCSRRRLPLVSHYSRGFRPLRGASRQGLKLPAPVSGQPVLDSWRGSAALTRRAQCRCRADVVAAAGRAAGAPSRHVASERTACEHRCAPPPPLCSCLTESRTCWCAVEKLPVGGASTDGWKSPFLRRPLRARRRHVRARGAARESRLQRQLHLDGQIRRCTGWTGFCARAPMRGGRMRMGPDAAACSAGCGLDTLRRDGRPPPPPPPPGRRDRRLFNPQLCKLSRGASKAKRAGGVSRAHRPRRPRPRRRPIPAALSRLACPVGRGGGARPSSGALR